MIVGPSGSGKTSIARELWGTNAKALVNGASRAKQELATLAAGWPGDAPIIDAVLPHKITGAFDEITAALSAVGLGSVPAWLRPFHLLSNGEQFRAALARLLLEPPDAVSVVDEFTSVVDRVVAKIGAAAFAKAWRRKHPGQQFVALSPHYDILDWLEPDWVIDTKQKTFTRGRLRRRPKIELEIRRADGKMWRYFKPHYYLDLHYPVAAQYFIGWVGDEPVAHWLLRRFSRHQRASVGEPGGPRKARARDIGHKAGGYARMAGRGAGNALFGRDLPVASGRQWARRA